MPENLGGGDLLVKSSAFGQLGKGPVACLGSPNERFLAEGRRNPTQETKPKTMPREQCPSAELAGKVRRLELTMELKCV